MASFFVSRVDTEIAKQLDALGTDEAKALKGEAGVANTRLAYQVYEELFPTERWKRPGRGRRTPPAPAVGLHRREGPGLPGHPVRYRPGRPARGEHHAGEDLGRRLDHGAVTGDTVTGTYAESNEVLDALEKIGVSYNDVVAKLETEGLEKFVASWKELLTDVRNALDTASKDG